MADEKTVVMESGTENRTITWGVTPDGKAYVREMSRGDLTEMMFDASEREMTVTFESTDDYSLADLAATVDGHADDCIITNFEDALTLWDIPFTTEEKTVPLVA